MENPGARREAKSVQRSFPHPCAESVVPCMQFSRSARRRWIRFDEVRGRKRRRPRDQKKFNWGPRFTRGPFRQKPSSLLHSREPESGEGSAFPPIYPGTRYWIEIGRTWNPICGVPEPIGWPRTGRNVQFELDSIRCLGFESYPFRWGAFHGAHKMGAFEHFPIGESKIARNGELPDSSVVIGNGADSDFWKRRINEPGRKIPGMSRGIRAVRDFAGLCAHREGARRTSASPQESCTVQSEGAHEQEKSGNEHGS